jgi:hypothetical protein
LTIRRVPLADLHLDPANVRLHDEKNVGTIKASLSRFQQVEPLVVQRSTGRLIAGHGRVAAMRELGWTEADIVEVDVNDTQAAAMAITLNRSGELAMWDLPALGKILDSLKDEFPLEDLGFDAKDLDELIAQEPVDLDDPGPQEPPERATSRPGDLWQLGEHRLLCCDSTKPSDIERLLAGERPTLFSSDPPYCVNYTGNDLPTQDGRPSGEDLEACPERGRHQRSRRVDGQGVRRLAGASRAASLGDVQNRWPCDPSGLQQERGDAGGVELAGRR